MSASTDQFKRLVEEDIPLIDVRAPVEFTAGAFPTSVSRPLMTDEERRLVGICYKQSGQDAAIELGHSLVTGSIKTERVDGWVEFISANPTALIYCFRGGLRSRLSQAWASEALGREVIRIEGGYKAFRTWLMGQLDPMLIPSAPIVLGGRTGCGKTRLLQDVAACIDLEAIANHRGSSFGRYTTAQPTQIDFENRLAWALIQHRAAGHRKMVVEDEGRHIGCRYLPKPLVAHFAASPVVQLEVAFDERVEITFDEYVTQAQGAYGVQGLSLWLDDMQKSLLRIRKRLGGERLKRVAGLMQAAFDHQQRTGDAALHRDWVAVLLREYYDPMYDFQLENKRAHIVFKGDASAVRTYLMEESI